ncbi:hypothetical protein CBS147332_4574 [Penicillium roqueforti]|nr:hypothetical protein CBS147332_4574 [Penicillium roqueforti]KAI3119485.1 hypothetical protein CBS147331_2897 [Penicillium roqueforti]
MAPAALQRVSALFCTHKSSVRMLEMNPWVISMDCTQRQIGTVSLYLISRQHERIIGNFRTIVRSLIWDLLSLARVQLFEAGNEVSFCRPLVTGCSRSHDLCALPALG